MTISPENVIEVVSQLDHLDKRAITEVVESERGRGPSHLMVELGISKTRAKAVLKKLQSLGICDFGSLFTDDGLLAGRGYWFGLFGEAVRRHLNEADEPATCPICNVPFKPEDDCITDITLGVCHASDFTGDDDYVDLETGEPLATGVKPIPYKFSEVI